MKTKIICSALTGILLLGHSQTTVETEKNNTPSPAPSESPGCRETSRHALSVGRHGNIFAGLAGNGNTYDIVVSLPGNYASAPAGKTFPVVYVLDAQWQSL